MKLLKVVIKNFRQFYGEQEIVFSTDREKNVTLIHGENNGGKTSLLNAIRWCLFQTFTPNFDEQNKLVNVSAKAEGILKFSVGLTIEQNGILYSIQRFSTNGNINGVLNVAIIKDGAHVIQENAQFLINSIIPQNMAEFFFYQGEGTGKLTNTNNFEYIRNSIKKILGFEIAQNALIDLKNVKNGYNKSLANCDVTGSLDTLYDQQSITQNTLNSTKQNISNLIDEINKLQIRFEIVDKKIKNSNVEVINEQIKSRSKSEQRLKEIESDIYSLELFKRSNVPAWAKGAFSKRLELHDFSELNISELNLAHKFSVDKNLIKQLIEASECICGTELKHNSTQESQIKALLSSAVDTELKARWKRVDELRGKLNDRANITYSSMSDNINKLDILYDRKKQTLNDINELTAKISSVVQNDISSFESERSELLILLDSKKSKLTLLKPQLTQLETKLKSITGDIKAQEGALPQGEKLKKLIFATDQIIKLIESALNEAEKGSDDVILKKMQNFFERVSFSGLNVRKIQNQWRIVNADGNPEGVGGGYQTMLSISFVVSLIQHSSDRANSENYLLTPGTVAPFIADAILSEVSADNGKALLGYVSECVEQAVFMLSQIQWTETGTDKEIRARIGKEYNFVECTTKSQDEWSGSYPTKLSVGGKMHDVVRFDSNFKGSIIEDITND